VSARLRQALVDTAVAMGASGLARGTSGNASVRLDDDRYLITPSGVSKGKLAPGDLIELRLPETPREEGRPRASSEWRFHRDIYAARPEVGAIVHGHPPFSTALACARKGIPPFHYLVALAGGHDIRCAAYATFGTQALSDAVLAALAGRRACLLANHGLVAVGGTTAEALDLALEIEGLAEQYGRALQVGAPVLLDPAEMDRILLKLADYRARTPGR
jgi:L-fuculose-phosphate aldolase